MQAPRANAMIPDEAWDLDIPVLVAVKEYPSSSPIFLARCGVDAEKRKRFINCDVITSTTPVS
jgi:hypothetical protein